MVGFFEAPGECVARMKSMNSAPFAWMICAIACELIGTTALKLTQGGERPVWFIAVACGYTAAFVLFSRALTSFPLGIAYAMWAGLGIVGSTVIGFMLFREPLSWTSLSGILVILAGVVLVNLGNADRLS
jgi:small multidrug resistance pump